MRGRQPAKVITLPRVTVTAGFNFSRQIRQLCDDLCKRLPELSHIEMDRVAIGYSQARRATRYGLQATLTPMRFEGGGLQTTRFGRLWTVQRLYDPDGIEMLYVLNFYLPRFLEGPLEDKLTTIIHELWHISPSFNGDLRRHPGRCYAHSSSQRKYDEKMLRLANKWLQLDPPGELFGFLRLSFEQLARLHGGVWSLRIPAPKLLPLSALAQ